MRYFDIQDPPPHRALQLTVVSSLSLGGEGVLSLLVLGNLVGLVLAASLGGADWSQMRSGWSSKREGRYGGSGLAHWETND